MIQSAREWKSDKQALFSAQFENIPYKKNGVDVSGVDDAGLVRFFYDQLGVSRWASDPTDKKRWRKIHHPLFGDVAMFEGEGALSRMGLIIEAPRFLYAHPRLGVTSASLDMARHCDFIKGFYRIKK